MWPSFIFIYNSFKQIFRNLSYIALSLGVVILIIALTVWIREKELLWYVLNVNLFSWSYKLKFILTSPIAFRTLFIFTDQIIIITIAILNGINLSLLIFYLRDKVRNLKMATLSSVGLVMALLGIGCASCGSIILTTFLGVGFSVGLLGWLPWHGLEISLVGIILLLVSIYLLAKKISQPKVC